MKRALLILSVLAPLAVLASDASASHQPPSRAAPRASRVAQHLQVILVEYRLLLSRGVVKAGPVNLEEIDRGMDPHDLRLQHVGSPREISAPLLAPGQQWDGVVVLKSGVYRLFCSLPGHEELGMLATLRVLR
jgi:hypothetical protein